MKSAAWQAIIVARHRVSMLRNALNAACARTGHKQRRAARVWRRCVYAEKRHGARVSWHDIVAKALV